MTVYKDILVSLTMFIKPMHKNFSSNLPVTFVYGFQCVVDLLEYVLLKITENEIN